ncbi:hypothetical protein WH240_13500 [Gluconobacter wancherniae]
MTVLKHASLAHLPSVTVVALAGEKFRMQILSPPSFAERERPEHPTT